MILLKVSLITLLLIASKFWKLQIIQIGLAVISLVKDSFPVGNITQWTKASDGPWFWQISQSRIPARYRRRMVTEDNDRFRTISNWFRKAANYLSTTYFQLKLEEHSKFWTKSWENLSSMLNVADDLRRKVPYNEIILTAAATTIIIIGVKRGMRRFKTATEIPLHYYRDGKKLNCYVVTVNDSDNLRAYHRRFFSFGKPNVDRQDLKYETINVRLAGVDAPEIGHFGGKSQPYAEEAKAWLTKFVQGKYVTIQIHRLDQYSRAVASVYVRKWGFLKKNVSLAMIEAGYATVYESAGAEYGGHKEIFVEAEKLARRKRKGMWKQSISSYISPAEYKRQQRSL